MKKSDIIQVVLDTIEHDKKYLLIKLNESNHEFIELNAQQITNKMQKDYLQNCCLVDLLIHFVLNINKKYMLPSENLVSICINSSQETMFKVLSEIVINLFNFESMILIIIIIVELIQNKGSVEQDNSRHPAILQPVILTFSRPKFSI